MRKAALVSLMLLLPAFTPAMAATNVCGNVYDTWTKANSPYYVTCDVLVVGLTIEPGVKVIATGPWKIEIAGTLTAVGTAADSITFTCADTVASWRGLFFNYSAPGTLAFCDVSKSTNHGILIDNSAVEIHDCLIHDNTTANAAQHYGGGIWTNMPLALAHCTIRNNSTSSGGIAFGGGVYGTQPMIVTGSLLRNNTSTGVGGYGGAIFCEDSVSIYNSTIRENTASDGSGGAVGGGVYCRKSVRAFDTLFRRNTASGYNYWGLQVYGGGLYTERAALLQRCRVDSNSVVATGGYGCGYAYGGGLRADDGLTLVNAIIADNTLSATCGGYGGGVFLNAGVGVVLNSTIAYNGTSGIDAGTNPISMLNSILFFNGGGTTQIAHTGYNVRFCDVQGGYGAAADSNLNLNPIFGSRSLLKIVNGSPCIDRGSSRPEFADACFSSCADPNDPLCLAGSLGGIRNDVGVGGGPFACTGPQLGPVSVDDAPAVESASLALSPNPARGPVRIAFALSHGSRTRVTVLDVMGREVARVLDAWYPAGRHEVAWDGTTPRGRAPAGVYFVRLQAGPAALDRRIVRMP